MPSLFHPLHFWVPSSVKSSKDHHWLLALIKSYCGVVFYMFCDRQPFLKPEHCSVLIAGHGHQTAATYFVWTFLLHDNIECLHLINIYILITHEVNLDLELLKSPNILHTLKGWTGRIFPFDSCSRCNRFLLFKRLNVFSNQKFIETWPQVWQYGTFWQLPLPETD